MIGRDEPGDEPLTSDEFDEMTRTYERERAIPMRLRDIEKFVAEIRANPADIRNTPDCNPRRGGGTYVSGVTDLQKVSDHVAAVRRYYERGDFLVAQSSLRDLEVRIRQVNARLTAPLIERAVKDISGKRKAADKTNKIRKLWRDGTPEKYVAEFNKHHRGGDGCPRMQAYKLAGKKYGVGYKPVQTAVKAKERSA